MDEFIWIGWNLQKIANHALTPDEVEFAWRNGRVVWNGNHPVNGPYAESQAGAPRGE